MKLFVGLDVSSKNLDACFLTDDEELTILKEARFENSFLGASQIKKLNLDFAALIQKMGRGRFKNPEATAKTIAKAIRGNYRLGKIQQDSVDVVLSVYAREIRSLTNLIKELDQAIQEIVEALPEYRCLTSIPGVGSVYAGGILAEIGQIERFENEAKIAKYAGLHWPKNQSGDKNSENTSLAKRGNRYLRYYLVEAANLVRLRDAEYKEFYHKKYNETAKHQHKRAIVLTARKFVSLVDILLRNHQLYVPQRGLRQ